MKKLWVIIFMGVLVFSACQTAQTPVPTVEEVAAPEAAPTAADTTVVLEVAGPDGSRTFTMTQLKELPAQQGFGGIKSSTGKITLPEEFTGVKIQDLVAEVGSLDETMGVELEAADGYTMTFSYNQIENGDFIVYDPGTGNETKNAGTLIPLIAYARNGEPLDEKSDGVLRLAIVSETNNQVVDGHWAVKWVTKVTLKPLSREWILQLVGKISESMDRGTFESGANPGCHGATWTDNKAQDWVGIPLWLLVGRVDDEIAHDGPAFNDELVPTNYSVVIKSDDGTEVTFDSNRVNRNDGIIVAFKVNGNPLNDEDFPLKLVGDDVSEEESIGRITGIEIKFPNP